MALSNGGDTANALRYREAMISRLLALLAVLALLVSPLNAMAAQVSCDDMMAGDTTAAPAAAMAAMDMQPGGDPCCDHGNGQSGKACLHACITMAGACATLPSDIGPAAVVWARFTTATPTATAARSHDPTAAERPPRSIA